MANEVELPRDMPFRAEYAKSGRAKCKGCSVEIPKGDLRLAIMTKSRFFDGMQASWFHFDCFRARAKPKSVGDISHFESLRWDDQKKIEKIVGIGGAGEAKQGGKKAGKADWMIEYAKSSRSVCPACENKIDKQVMRIGKKDYESDAALQYGPLFRWHHVSCFIKVREELEFFASGKTLPGFRDLEKEDKKSIESQIPEIKTAGKRKLSENGEVAAKKIKTENGSGDDRSHEKLIEKQNKAMYKIRDSIKEAHEEKEVTKSDLELIFRTNKQDIPVGPDQMYDRLADIMTFGALQRCEVCKTGQIVYRSGVGYFCLGYLTEYTKCARVVDKPKRVEFKVPRDIADVSFFQNYKPKAPCMRIVPKHAPTTVTPSSSKASSGGYKGPKLNSKPLEKLSFYMDETLDSSLAKTIEKFGGKISKKMRSKLMAVVSTEDQLKKKPKFLKGAEERKIPVVSPAFVENIREVDYKLTEQLQTHLIVDWIKPLEISSYVEKLVPQSEKEKEKKNMLELEMKKVKLRMKDGAVVDPDSELEEVGHVYKEGNKFFAYILNKVDVDSGDNKYYKLQIIESDNKKKYWVFRSWGRLGTTIGSSKVQDMSCIEDAKDLFHQMYEEKTGNEFGKTFKKKPGCYFPLDIDYGEKKQLAKLEPSTKNSKLGMAVQKLICKIFNVEDMQRTLLEFELDLEKMPLGKLSQNQIMKAYKVLSEATELLQKDTKEDGHKRKVVDVTNRFFTLIPHSVGIADLPLLNDLDFIKVKLDMLENMMEIELAMEMLQQGEDDGKSPIDAKYKSLKCQLAPLERGSKMWGIIEKYLLNTHAETHDAYELVLEEVFTVDRKGEAERYEKFKDFHNRKLLWHGSRTSNYAGILSQGLRIAPKEAPVTGYMFGKGVYFADMVSKSANYCFTSPNNNTGFLLLSEVALGDMHELLDAKESLLKAPRGKHSVKGVGKTEPDPFDVFELPTGTVVPYGKPTKSKVKNSSLLYNEYIVYDVAQVHIAYMLQVNFKYKGRR